MIALPPKQDEMQAKAKSGRFEFESTNSSSRVPAFDPKGTSAYPFGPAINFPYPDRPYGDPSGW